MVHCVSETVDDHVTLTLTLGLTLGLGLGLRGHLPFHPLCLRCGN